LAVTPNVDALANKGMRFHSSFISLPSGNILHRRSISLRQSQNA
jgi:hypothetical protein